MNAYQDQGQQSQHREQDDDYDAHRTEANKAEGQLLPPHRAGHSASGTEAKPIQQKLDGSDHGTEVDHGGDGESLTGKAAKSPEQDARFDFRSQMVTAWQGVRGPKDSDMNLVTLLAVTRLPNIKERLESLQERFTRVLIDTGHDWDAAKDEIRSDKECLLAFECGTADERGDKNIKSYAHVVIGDIDKLTSDAVADLLPRIKADPHVIDAGISPSGHGVKALFAVSGDLKQHRQNWEAVRQYVLKNYGHEIDPQTKNPERLCFVFRCELGEPNWQAIPLDPIAETPNAKREESSQQSERGKAGRAAEAKNRGDRHRDYERVVHRGSDPERKPISADVLRELLSYIPSDDRQTWFVVLGAVNLWGKETDQEDLAYEIADEWARTSDKYDEEDQQHTWDKLEREAGENVATVGSLFHLAKQKGWRPKRDYIVLPSGHVSISDCARELFERSKRLYLRGNAVVERIRQDGIARLELVSPDAFRTRAERLGTLLAWRAGRDGELVLKQTKMSGDDAKAILASLEAREILPPLASVVRCPICTVNDSGKFEILGPGYYELLGGILIDRGEMPPEVGLKKAVRSLLWLLEEFDFDTASDKSRAVAALVTPALRMGGFLPENVPIDVAEADCSQSGKGYRHKITCALYGETPYVISPRNGGVGSADESFASALVAARPFICLDNLRGKLDSTYLEAFLTAPGLFPARIPHRAEVMVDPTRFCLQLTSNGMESTRDLANRASICRIRKRPGYQYDDTLGHLEKRQPYFLGCVCAVVREWHDAGQPRTKDARHDFREWCQALDWIVQEIFGLEPLMDGHQRAQERVSDPALSWLRAVALEAARTDRLGVALTASTIVELCQGADISLPNLKAGVDDKVARQAVGAIMRRVFQGDQLELEAYTIKRTVKRCERPCGDGYDATAYIFEEKQ